jgi:hypothetical protein
MNLIKLGSLLTPVKEFFLMCTICASGNDYMQIDSGSLQQQHGWGVVTSHGFLNMGSRNQIRLLL